MSPLPQISGKKVIAALTRYGYEKDHQTGSHVVMRQSCSPFRRLTVPDHKEIAKGTLRAIIRQTGLTVKEFTALLKN